MHKIFIYFYFIFSTDSLSASSQHRLFERETLTWKYFCFEGQRTAINCVDFPFLPYWSTICTCRLCAQIISTARWIMTEDSPFLFFMSTISKESISGDSRAWVLQVTIATNKPNLHPVSGRKSSWGMLNLWIKKMMIYFLQKMTLANNGLQSHVPQS